VHNPISKRVLKFGETEVAKFRFALFEELKKKRKVALRLGKLKDFGNWQIFTQKMKALLKGEIQFSEITEEDIFWKLNKRVLI
jgi:hypothetical protein